MRPVAFTFPYFIVFAGVFLWAFVREAGMVNRASKAAARGDAPADRGSLRVVMLTQALAFGASFALAWAPFGLFGYRLLAFWIGVALILGGAGLRRLCFRALGASFTGEVRVRPDQRVVSSGPYRWVRHPSYTAGMLMIVGVAVAFGSWLGAAISLATSLAGYAYRVWVEERALADALGAPYREYMSRTKRFVPFLL